MPALSKPAKVSGGCDLVGKPRFSDCLFQGVLFMGALRVIAHSGILYPADLYLHASHGDDHSLPLLVDVIELVSRGSSRLLMYASIE
jgi:hypothetical protein